MACSPATNCPKSNTMARRKKSAHADIIILIHLRRNTDFSGYSEAVRVVNSGDARSYRRRSGKVGYGKRIIDVSGLSAWRCFTFFLSVPSFQSTGNVSIETRWTDIPPVLLKGGVHPARRGTDQRTRSRRKNSNQTKRCAYFRNDNRPSSHTCALRRILS